jgi:hypothetical protein
VVHAAVQDLNGGNDVPDAEIDWVIESSDGKGPLKLADGVLNKEVRICCRGHTTAPHAVLVQGSRVLLRSHAWPVLVIVRLARGPLVSLTAMCATQELKVAVAVWYLNVSEKSKQSSACSIL